MKRLERSFAQMLGIWGAYAALQAFERRVGLFRCRARAERVLAPEPLTDD